MGLPHGGANYPVLRPFVAWLFVSTLRDFSRPLLGRLLAFGALQIEDGRCDLGSEPDSYDPPGFPGQPPTRVGFLLWNPPWMSVGNRENVTHFNTAFWPHHKAPFLDLLSHLRNWDCNQSGQSHSQSCWPTSDNTARAIMVFSYPWTSSPRVTHFRY